jgi:hypothetical protein
MAHIQILTSAQIAEGIITQLDGNLPTTEAELANLLEVAARGGKAAGLQYAQKDMFAGWPQGQYDRFNEHQLAARLKRRIEKVMGRLQGAS